MTQAEYIIAKFGGINAMASKLGHRNCTTVQGWLKRGNIPAWQWQKILAIGQVLNEPLTPEDFVRHLKPRSALQMHGAAE